MDVVDLLMRLLQGGLGNLAAYLAAHVLLCLVPAFFIAGAMTALIPKNTVTHFLGAPPPSTSPTLRRHWLGPYWPSARVPSSLSLQGSTRRAPA